MSLISVGVVVSLPRSQNEGIPSIKIRVALFEILEVSDSACAIPMPRISTKADRFTLLTGLTASDQRSFDSETESYKRLYAGWGHISSFGVDELRFAVKKTLIHGILHRWADLDVLPRTCWLEG